MIIIIIIVIIIIIIVIIIISEMFWTAVWRKTWVGCFWQYVCKTIYLCSRKVALPVFTEMPSASFFVKIKNYSQRNSVGIDKENCFCNFVLFLEICASYESLMKRDHWKRTRSLCYRS